MTIFYHFGASLYAALIIRTFLLLKRPPCRSRKRKGRHIVDFSPLRAPQRLGLNVLFQTFASAQTSSLLFAISFPIVIFYYRGFQSINSQADSTSYFANSTLSLCLSHKTQNQCDPIDSSLRVAGNHRVKV